MMEVPRNLPLALEVSKEELQERRLWVGNLDQRINEYKFLKLIQKYGNIEKFDFLFHKTGPQSGQPRGYGFVTYKTAQDARIAMIALQNLKIGSKYVRVRYAHSINEDDIEKPKPQLEIIPALTGAKKDDKKLSRETAIQAIEAKLKMMEDSEVEFDLNKPLAGTSMIYQYQRPDTTKSSNSTRQSYRHSYHNKKPYTRGRLRR